jgi:demethylmenaquinone methyltransferase / 2-methoxy-6-polyprenyl-1,4-benzoquinol methylase
MTTELKTPVTPYNDSREKKEQVEAMFNNIAHRYDRLNQVLSLGIHHGWRKKAVNMLIPHKPKLILDLATGTGDFAIEGLRTGAEKIIGADISEGMMEFGKKKVEKLGLKDKIAFRKGDAENLEFADNTFDAITIGFGVRNFQDLEKGLKEMLRVLKPGGKAVILEFSKAKGWFKPFYSIYFKSILPIIGKLISKDTSAYTYLPSSVNAFPEGEDFISILKKCGYRNAGQRRLTFGVATIYSATK